MCEIIKDEANIRKFNKELELYVTAKDYELFWSNIRYLNCIKDKRWCFYMAHHAYKVEKDVNIAKYYIDLSIENLEDKQKAIAIESFLDLEGIRVEDFSIYTVKNKSIHSLAGEIYSQIDQSMALYYYQLFHLDITNLKPFGHLKDLDHVILYSFRPISKYTLADLINHEITVSPIQSMNDPFDCIASLWASEANLYKICKEKNHIPPFSKSFDFYRIRSFVANTDTYKTDDSIIRNTLMWSHYADKHKGICIRYKLSSHFIKGGCNDMSRMYLRHVIYGNEANLNITKIKSGIDFCFKNKDWEYEREVRLVSYDASTDEQWIGIPLDQQSKIEAIYFGYSCNHDDKRQIMQILKNEGILFYDMIIDTQRNIYNLIPKNILFSQ